MYVVSTLLDVNQFIIHFAYGPQTGAMMILNLVILGRIMYVNVLFYYARYVFSSLS